jgi:hypothetical protein
MIFLATTSTIGSARSAKPNLRNASSKAEVSTLISSGPNACFSSKRWMGIARLPLFARWHRGSQGPSPTSPLAADDVNTINMGKRNLQGKNVEALAPHLRRSRIIDGEGCAATMTAGRASTASATGGMTPVSSCTLRGRAQLDSTRAMRRLALMVPSANGLAGASKIGRGWPSNDI